MAASGASYRGCMVIFSGLVYGLYVKWLSIGAIWGMLSGLLKPTVPPSLGLRIAFHLSSTRVT